MRKNIFKSLFAALLVMLVACETTELDLLDSPNGVDPSNANVQLLLNGAQLNFKELLEVQGERPMQLTRMVHMFGPTYDNGITSESLNTLWSRAYGGVNTNSPRPSGVLADIKVIKEKGVELELFEHVGVAKIIESYVLTTLVDLFGDVPYSETLLLTENLNPAADDDQEVYMAALALLDEAIADLEKTSARGLAGSDDIFYGGSTSKWTKLAKTLKLRIHNNMRLVDPAGARTAINALIADNDLILSAADDFEVKYGTQDNDPDVRHYKFIAGYLGDGGEYMSTWFMNTLKNAKSVEDPRIKYYFYRQTLTYPDPSTPEGLFTLPCLGETKPLHFGFADPFCKIGDGYWGRDHMNNDGGPPDGNQITLWGLYPIGGKFDNGQGTPGNKSAGAKGEGIYPIWNAAATNFVLAEAAQELGVSGDAKAYLEAGMRASFAKVINFNTEAVPEGAEATDAEVDAYVEEVLNAYDAASPAAKMNIIITEAFISHWGNGLETYNAYRRTGYPNNLSPTISSMPGKFIRSLPYPANSVNRNQNMSAKPNNEVKVFWDTETADLK